MKKQISRGVVLSFISQAIAIVVGLVYMPVMINILGQSEYGLYQLVQSVVNYLNLMNFGFSGAYIRFFSLAKAENDREGIANLNGMFLRVFLLISLLCTAAGAVLYFRIDILGTHLTPEDYVIAKKLLIIMVLNLAISFPSSLFTVYMSANERFVFQHAVNIVVNVLTPLLTLPLLWLGAGSVGLVSIALLLTVFRLLANLWYCVKKLDMRMNIRYFDRRIFSGLVGFTFFIFLSDMVDQMNLNVDKFLLGRIIGTVSVAVYSVGFNLCTYYKIVSWVIPEMFIPEANRLAIEEKDDNKLTEIFTRIGRYNNYILMLVLTGFILLGKPFIMLWVGPGYETSYYAALILIVAAYIPSVQTLGVNIQNAKNMHRMRSAVYFAVACVNVAASVFLIRKWGVIGTSLGTLFAVLLGTGAFMNVYYHRKVGLNVFTFWKDILRWTVPACLLCGAAWLATRHIVITSWLALLAYAGAYSVVYGGLLWLVGMKREDRDMLSAIVRRARGKAGNEGDGET